MGSHQLGECWREGGGAGLTVQVAPFWQGLGSHSLISSSQVTPVNPASQSHSKPGGGTFSCRGRYAILIHLASLILTIACSCSEHFWEAHVTCSSVAGASKAVLDVLVTCGSCPAIRTIAKEPSIQVLTYAEWEDTIIIGVHNNIGYCVHNRIHNIYRI